MTITVGCSGWSYDDWIGRFFPFEIRDDNAKRFEHYAEFFNSVEVNSTFYRMPGIAQVNSWVEKAKTHPGFEFSVKMPRSVTHEALVDNDDKTAVKHALFFEQILALPLNDVGGLGAILLQMSPSFHNTGESFEALSRFLGSLSVGEFHYALEFRHKSWLNDNHHLLSDTVRLLRDNHIANVIVDGPGFSYTSDLTADSAYLRFHGRNFDIWYHEEKEDDERLDRYDYLYTEEQLEPWVPRIRDMEDHVSKVRVFFNNHGRAKSAKNALELMDMLNIPHKPKVIHVQDQAKLEMF
jgi:uncharacterized protein YecE (DUF72 family)